MPFASASRSAYTTTCLTDTDGDGSVWRWAPLATKQRWTARPPLLIEQSTFPFPLVAEAVLCMSLSQGCTAEYRTVLRWSTADTSAGPATHTVRSAVLQNALPSTNYQHQPYPPAYVDPVKSVSHQVRQCQSAKSHPVASAGRQLNVEVQNRLPPPSQHNNEAHNDRKACIWAAAF